MYSKLEGGLSCDDLGPAESLREVASLLPSLQPLHQVRGSSANPMSVGPHLHHCIDHFKTSCPCYLLLVQLLVIVTASVERLEVHVSIEVMLRLEQF